MDSTAIWGCLAPGILVDLDIYAQIQYRQRRILYLDVFANTRPIGFAHLLHLGMASQIHSIFDVLCLIIISVQTFLGVTR